MDVAYRTNYLLIEILFIVVYILHDSTLICICSLSTDLTGRDGCNIIYKDLVETAGL